MLFLRSALLGIGLLAFAACGGGDKKAETTPAQPCGANPCDTGDFDPGDDFGQPCGDDDDADTENPCGDDAGDDW
jgi:hypothetical protein